MIGQQAAVLVSPQSLADGEELLEYSEVDDMAAKREKYDAVDGQLFQPPAKRLTEMKKASTFANLHYQPRVIRVN